MIRVLHVRVGEAPEVVYIDHSLQAMQRLVGGLIELVRLPSGVDLWINEEGLLLNGSRPNRYVREIGGEVRGDFFLARHDGEGNSASLTDRDIKSYAQIFKL